MSCLHDGYCTDIAAARGTPCDDPSLNKWCKDGKCVAKGTSDIDFISTTTTTTTEPTTTLSGIPEGCTNTDWYFWSCEQLSTYFKDNLNYDPEKWCLDPSWQDRCCGMCYENGIYYKK
ncbi:uncharacterized protein LOC127856839 isoform X2 [Dreissena polymorpha]|uniref:uncharacterized protein LOC127856839 isoform X2 n=1 Tax=Dreissena polymorpha TaxID=45954 RepID=UPI002264349A|nr:uncharacterized protein LOC127856839 isoform X2 [Dreissena polymorpha]